MGSQVIDMTLLQNSFSTKEMRDVWDERNRLAQQLKTEAALALAEGELGVIPAEAAQKIVAAADANQYDLAELAQMGLTTKHSLMATIKKLQEHAGEAGEYVHYGATTQDIVDTATVLQLQQANAIVERDLHKVIALLAKVAKEHQYTPMAGRTHGTQALPITFGFKLSIILAELGRHVDRLHDLQERAFVGVLAGAVGTYASLEDKGAQVEALTMQKLGLGVPEICWHAARDRFAEYAGVLAMISATLGKMGHEFYFLMHSEINEVEEPFSKGKIGSSTMPQKRNPAAFEGLASLARPVFYGASLVREAMLMEHERDAMAWRAEWIALPEICAYIANQFATAISVLDGLIVKKENMLKNLNMSGGLIVAEKIMFELGKYVGKQTAHEIVYNLAMEAQEQNEAFGDLLKTNEQVAQYFTQDEIDGLLDPMNYLGHAAEKVDSVLALARKKGWLADE